MAAIKEKDSAPARKNVPASSSFSITVGKAKSNPKLPPFSSEVLDPTTGKPLPHYLWPTASSCHYICKYGKRHVSLNPPAPRRLSEVKSESGSPSQLPSLSSSSSHRRCSSASSSPRHPSGKAPASPFTRTVSFGRTTIMKTSRLERHPTTTIPSKQRHPPAFVTKKDPVTAVKNTKIVSSTGSGSVTVSNIKKMVKDSDSSNVQEDKIQDKTMIVEEVRGSQGEESEHEVPLESPADIPPSQEQTTITIKTVNEPTETETTTVATDEQYEERESFTVENSPTTSSLKLEHPLPEQPQQDHYNEGATDIKPAVAADVDPPKDLVDVSVIEKEREGAEKEENEDKQEEEEEKEAEEEENEDKQDKQEEEEEKEAEKEDNKEKQKDKEVEEINDFAYDEYSEGDDSEPDEDEEEEPKEIQEIGAEQRPTVKPRAQRDGIRKVRGVEGKEDTPKKLRFRRGTVLSPKAEEDANKPKKFRFRRGRVIDKQEDGDANSSSSSRQRRSFNRKEEEKMDDTNSAKEKKDSSVVFNQVIEQTANKLVESRKSKVKALVGAFETVISIHETDAQTSQGHSHA